MNEPELKALNKEAKKRKRIASEWAAKVHDVVEESLWNDYPQLADLAEQTIAACEAWKAAELKLAEAKA